MFVAGSAFFVSTKIMECDYNNKRKLQTLENTNNVNSKSIRVPAAQDPINVTPF